MSPPIPVEVGSVKFSPAAFKHQRGLPEKMNKTYRQQQLRPAMVNINV
jgi:hypothetical protein